MLGLQMFMILCVCRYHGGNTKFPTCAIDVADHLTIHAKVAVNQA